MADDTDPRRLSDGALATRLAAPGVERALYAEAYRRFFPFMLREAALLVGGNMALAEDIVQECFARLLSQRQLERLRTPEHLRSYLRIAVRHAAIDAVRRRTSEEARERFTTESEEAMFEPPDLLKTHPGLGPILERLSEPDREILKLRFVQDLDLREIALRLNLRYSAVAQRLSRAIQRSREVGLTL